MRCNELLEAMNDYLDGDERLALCCQLKEHLAGCASCRIVLDNIRQTITLCRAGQAVPLPAELHERIRSLMRDRWPVKDHTTRQVQERENC